VVASNTVPMQPDDRRVSTQTNSAEIVLAPERGAFAAWFARNGRVLATILFMVVMWEVLVRVLSVPQYLVPAPSKVFAEFSERYPLVFRHALSTLYVIAVGYGLAVLISVPLALMIAFSRFLETTVYPVFVLFQTIPKIAIAPLFIIWFGFGVTPKLVLVFLLCFFPIIVSSIAGFKSINPEIMDFAKSTGANQWKVFRMIRLPAALPSIFIGLKVASVTAPTAAVVAEFVASDRGLGFLLLQFNGDLDTAMSFATIVVLSAIGLTLYYSVEWLEHFAIPWHASRNNQAAAQ
jgi:NitT/TauT family transport system permease protein